jgi:hypothetical protein
MPCFCTSASKQHHKPCITRTMPGAPSRSVIVVKPLRSLKSTHARCCLESLPPSSPAISLSCICVYVCMCVCVYMYVCVYVHWKAHMQDVARTVCDLHHWLLACPVYVCECMCMCARVHIYVCMIHTLYVYARLHIWRSRAHTQTHTYRQHTFCSCMYAYVYVCTYIHTQTLTA